MFLKPLNYILLPICFFFCKIARLGVYMTNDSNSNNSSAATIGYEPELWKAADALRGSMDAA
jgi:hypothetical protein